MKKIRISQVRFRALLGVPILFLLFFPDPGRAATTGTTAVLQQLGSGAPTSYGDYISSAQAGGMNTYHQYYIEVPPGLSQLRVRLFDADVGRGTTNRFDWQSGGSWNTSCRYTLYNPSGTSVATFTGSATAGTNNGWQILGPGTTPAPIPSPVAGHWRLVVDTSSAVTTGDDCNGYGISADDGDETSGGTEINIYGYTFVPVGERTYGGVNTVTTTLYPYVTSGCVVDWNDWDGDNPTPGVCTITYASRTRTFTGSYGGSGSTVWQNRPITGYESNSMASDTGVWRATLLYTETSSGGSNYGIFYVGDFNAASPPPTSQPQAYTQRIYLPTDGMGAPPKPFLTQNLSYISGPNPPTAGATTRVRVEVTIFNPTPRAITFSSISPITANVPGGGVVYAQHWVASQGSLVGEPALGGTGDIVWNPGTVGGSNADATMSYAVDVTPTYSGQRLPVTGMPSSNGTRASFTDETGVATFNYGPLCELAATEGAGGDVPTWIAVTSLESNMDGGRPTVEWRTGTEIGTAGFFLWRQNPETAQFELVNPSFLPALYESPLGGIYRLEDPGVPIGRPVVYRLTEVDASGRTRIYGPYKVTFGDSTAPSQRPIAFAAPKGAEVPSSIPGFRKWTYRPSELETKRVQDRLRVLQQGVPAPAAGSHDRIRIAVKTEGLVRLDAASIANSLAQSAQQVQWLILNQRLSLTSRGEPVAWLAEAGGAGIYFYGQAPDSAYTDRNVYWLEEGNGLVMEAVRLGAATPTESHPTFQDSAHFEDNRYAATALAKNAQEDFWFWNYIVAGTDDKSFAVDVPGRATTGAATLTALLRGATDTASVQDHHAKVSLNKIEVGSGWWNGTESYTFRMSVVPSLLKDGKNTITVKGLLDVGAPYSVFYVNSFDLSYPRYYRTKDNRLLCRGDGNPVISVEGLTDAQALVLDVTKPDRPKVCVGIVVDNRGRLAFVPASSQNRYLISGLSAALQPFSMTAAAAPTLKQADHFAEYLVIAPEEFKAAARSLANYRKEKGLESQVVTVEEIYDAFNWGLQSPLAIKDFLAFAYAKGAGNRPETVVLAGKGTYDYKNYLGFGDNLIPPILAKTPDGLFAADRAFGDVKGEDGVPEIVVGRLPVVSGEELAVAVKKIKAYESDNSSWPKRAIMIADNPDDAGNFRQGSEILIKQISGYSLQRIYLLNGFHADEVRSQIIAGLNANPALVNYLGHGGIDQLAGENILNVSDLPSLRNGTRLPIMVLLTCVAGRFEVPGSLSLAEGLALKDGGGIAAAVAPTGASTYIQTRQLAEELYKAVYGANERGLGKAWLRAMKNYISMGGRLYLLNIFNLIGDPALRFK